MRSNFKRGFTLIEVLLVIAILAILAGIVIVAINPGKQLANARDAQRMSDTYAILNAIHQYAIDNEGAFPEGITTEVRQTCLTSAPSCEGLYDLSVITDMQRYLVTLPIDPLCIQDLSFCADNGTGYEVSMSEGGRITVSAPNTEEVDIITVTR
jgi:prepilin-type N-terminal cleavage/methylation domain-containing protein